MSDAGTQKAIEARGLLKYYEGGRVHAVDGVDFDVAAGEFTAIRGPSGCGKTTLLNLLAVIDRPDAGTLDIAGRSLAGMSDTEVDAFRRDEIGLVFQLHNLLPNLTALENVQAPMLGTRLDGRGRMARAMELLERVGLGDRAHALPAVLSGGERQRVAAARALANKPHMVLADEPTGSLDSKSSDRLLDLLDEIQRESGATLIVVTHDEQVAERADRVLSMLDGRFV